MLHVETFGPADAPPLLAVHGITGFGARFRRLAELVPERRWLCPDLRGHGDSAATAPWRTEEHVADLLAVLDGAGVERCDLVGHSFGGHLAVHALAAAPERFDRVVLLDPASVLDADRAERRALEYARDPGWGSEEEARAEISTWFPNEGSRPDYEPEATRNLAFDGSTGRWRMRFSPVVIVAAYGEMCRPLPPLPTDHDVLLLEADPAESSVNDALRNGLAEALADRLHRAVVPRATHVLFRTELEGTAAPLRDFLLG
jgi:lipase